MLNFPLFFRRNYSYKNLRKMKHSKYYEKQNFRYHPKNVILSLILLSITALFLAFSFAYVYSRLQKDIPPIQLPTLFFFNTFILLASSATMWWAKQNYLKDNTEKYQLSLLFTIILSLIFLYAQFIAWSQLFNQEIFLTSSTTTSYLYLISGLHFLHVIAGLPFLISFLITAIKKMKEPVSVLVYFSDPKKRLDLRLLTIYWHYLDALWIYLVLFFWVNYLLA